MSVHLTQRLLSVRTALKHHTLIIAILGVAVITTGSIILSHRTAHKAVEVGFSETSPLGSAGGQIVPASCPSDLHDDPTYGQGCYTYNACGSANYGTYQCGGVCGASAPANPPGYGTTCTKTNACGQTYPPGATTCSQQCVGAQVGYWYWDGGYVGYIAYMDGSYASNTSCEAVASGWCTDTSGGTTICRTMQTVCTTPPSISIGTLNCSGQCTGTAPPNPTGYGNSCTSAPNACGQMSTGTIGCTGACSATTPGLPAGYGNACTSPANACGQTTAGTITCGGTCSATTAPANPVGYGTACQSAANSCGMRNSGTIGCSGACSATTPPDSSCSVCGDHICQATETALSCAVDCTTIPTTGTSANCQSLTAKPSVVIAGDRAKLTWNVPAAYACTITGRYQDGTYAQNGTVVAVTGSTQTVPLTSTQRITYTLSCTNAVSSCSYSLQPIRVVPPPKYQEQ